MAGLRFDGDIAHGKPLPHAPNPCLHIEGLDTVGLPLNDTEAQRVFEHSSRSRRSGTSVKIKTDKESIRDIEGPRVSFRSPVWKPSFNELLKGTCKALAALFSLNVPTCELRKLSLCRAGTPYVCSALQRDAHTYRFFSPFYVSVVQIIPHRKNSLRNSGSAPPIVLYRRTGSGFPRWFNEDFRLCGAIRHGGQHVRLV